MCVRNVVLVRVGGVVIAIAVAFTATRHHDSNPPTILVALPDTDVVLAMGTAMDMVVVTAAAGLVEDTAMDTAADGLAVATEVGGENSSQNKSCV